MPGKTLLLRADAGSEMGIGHVMRCLALSDAWRDSGGNPVFALAAGTCQLESHVRAHGAEIITVEAQPGSPEDASITLALGSRRQAAWLALDGYHFSAGYIRTLRKATSKLLLIADDEEVPNCDCDIVVDPTPQTSEAVRSWSDKQATVLLGPSYALLRREFLKYFDRYKSTADSASRILISFGGGDSHNVTLQVMQALQEIGDRELDVTVVVGPSNLHGESLQAAAEQSRHAVRLISDVSNMPEVMAQADLAITAGGGTCYELAFMQVPMLLITIAKNQERPISAYTAAKTAVAAGWFASLESTRLTRLLLDLIDNRSLRRELSLNARKLVDGKGPQRIVEKMIEMTGVVE